MNKYAAKIFANDWYELGDEKSDTQKFWWTFLRDVFDIAKPEKVIDFEISVPNGFIDAYIAKTKVLIEQKSFGVDLSKKIPQSDGKFLTPFEQAKRYAEALPADKKPRWIVTCNFSEFRIYNLTKNFFDIEPTIIKLRDLRYQFPRLRFLIDPNADDSPPEEKISAEALGVIDKIYKAFENNYKKNKVTDYEDALNKICTRLVFCLYAGDAQLFDANQFFDYLQSFNDAERNAALQNLFNVLNTPEDMRDDFDDTLKNFLDTKSVRQSSAQCLNRLSARKIVSAQAACFIPASKIFIRLSTRFSSTTSETNLKLLSGGRLKIGRRLSSTCKIKFPSSDS